MLGGAEMLQLIQSKTALLTLAALALATVWFSSQYIVDRQEPLPDLLLFVCAISVIGGAAVGMKRIQKLNFIRPFSLQGRLLQNLVFAILAFIPLAAIPYVVSVEAPEFEMRRLPNGEQATSMTWHTEEDRYFVVLNGDIEQEITRREYDEIQWRFSAQFYFGLLTFAYLAACFAWFIAVWPEDVNRGAA